MLPANSCVAYKNMIKQVVNCWRKTVVIICQVHQCKVMNWGSVSVADLGGVRGKGDANAPLFGG